MFPVGVVCWRREHRLHQKRALAGYRSWCCPGSGGFRYQPLWRCPGRRAEPTAAAVLSVPDQLSKAVITRRERKGVGQQAN